MSAQNVQIWMASIMNGEGATAAHIGGSARVLLDLSCHSG